MKSHVDNQVREMTDVNISVYKPFHGLGFNILKVVTSETSTGPRPKEYTRRMNFFSRKVDLWVTFRPPKELTDKYDSDRDAASRELNTRICQTGTYKATSKPKEQKATLAERNADKVIEKDGERIRQHLVANPGISTNKLAAEFGVSYQKMALVKRKLNSGS